MAPSSIPGDKDVVACIKKGMSIPAAAAQMKVTPSVMAGLYYRLEPVADPSLVIKGTPKGVAKQIVDGRSAGLRWERLAERSGKTVSEVKGIFEEASGVPASQSYSGRGRRFDGSAPAKKEKAEKAEKAEKPAAKKPVAKKPIAKKAPVKRGPVRAKTRAERAQKSGSPS
jgi:hypothetical protein